MVEWNDAVYGSFFLYNIYQYFFSNAITVIYIIHIIQKRSSLGEVNHTNKGMKDDNMRM